MNQYINITATKNGFSFDVNGKTIAATVDSLQNAVDFCISKLPVKDRQLLADKLEAEKLLSFDTRPDWAESVDALGMEITRINKLNFLIHFPDKRKLTSTDMEAIGKVCTRNDLIIVSELGENLTELHAIGGQDFMLSFPVGVAVRRAQERKAKAD